jgi:hypothetical protein
VVAVAGPPEGDLLREADGTLEILLLGAAVVGISVNAGTKKAGELLGESDGVLVGRLLGALEVGAPARTMVGTLEGSFLPLGDGEGTEEDTRGAIEGPGLGGDTGVAVAIIGLSMGATGGTLCRCNRRSLL